MLPTRVLRVLVEFEDVPPGVMMERVPPSHNDMPLGHLVHHYNRVCPHCPPGLEVSLFLRVSYRRQ